MAVDAFLELKDITGESQDATMNKKGAMDILDFNFHMHQPGGAGYGGGAGVGKVDFHDISIMKRFDTASPTLMGFCANGKHISKGTITVRKAGGPEPVDYLIIGLEDCLITAYSPSGLATGDGHESLTLTFSKFKLQYTSQDKTGKKDKSPEFGWDVKTNQQISGKAGS